jgi:hypothetical protein
MELGKHTYEGVWDSITSKSSGQQDLEDLSSMTMILSSSSSKVERIIPHKST